MESGLTHPFKLKEMEGSMTTSYISRFQFCANSWVIPKCWNMAATAFFRKLGRRLPISYQLIRLTGLRGSVWIQPDGRFFPASVSKQQFRPFQTWFPSW